MKNISIVVPIYNEEGNVAELHKEINDICIKNEYNYEIIFIDDGSSDNTEEIIRSLTPVKYIKLRKNFGQTAAMDAGIKEVKYEYIITMDGDRQNDPEDIPKLIEYLEEKDLDIVSGWRKKRKDPVLKRFTSRVAHLLRSILINDGIHDSGCSLKIYKKECFEQISLYGEMHRFIPAMLSIKGYKVGEVIVNHRARTAGVTKYTWKRTIKGFIDMVSVWFWMKYAVRPLHLLGTLGLCSFVMGFASFVISLVLFIINTDLSDTVWPLLSVFFTFSGMFLIISGLMADMVSKNYFETTKDSSYSIREINDL